MFGARPPLDGAILVTGASSGIGADIVRQLAPRARAIALVARRRDRLEALAAEIARPGLKVAVVCADLADPDAVEPLVTAVEAEIGPIDVLVNNAGFGDIGLLERADWAKIQRMIAVNVTALTALTWRLLPGMLARRRGGILLLSSGYGLTWMPGLAAYVGTKHYVSGFAESLRSELAGTGVVVTHVCPGPVTTEFETVAELPKGLRIPGIVQISSTVCARHALAAFARGRALVIPGWRAWLFVSLGRFTPDWLLRLVYRPLGPLLRART